MAGLEAIRSVPSTGVADISTPYMVKVVSNMGNVGTIRLVPNECCVVALNSDQSPTVCEELRWRQLRVVPTTPHSKTLLYFTIKNKELQIGQLSRL